MLTVAVTVLFRSASLVGYGLRDVFEIMILSGTADQELIAGAISEIIVNSMLAVIFYTIIAYPLYFFVRKKVKYPSLVVFVGLGILTCFSYEYDVVNVAIKIVALGMFIWLGLSVPSKITAKRTTLNN